MSKKKIIIGISIIIALIISLTLIIGTSTADTSDTQELQDIINNPSNDPEVLAERYETISQWYNWVETWDYIGDIDVETVRLVKSAATEVLRGIKEGNTGPGFDSYKNNLTKWITEIGNVVTKRDLDVSDLLQMIDGTASDVNELQRRYDILFRWSFSLEEKANNNLNDILIFRKAAKAVLEQFIQNNLDISSQNSLNRWINEAETIIVDKGRKCR